MSTYGSKTKRGKSETLFQPYLMASGQSKEVSCQVLGGDGAKKGLEEEEGKKQHPSIQVGEKIWGSPEFLTKGQFQRGAEGVTIYASAKGGHGKWRKDDGLEGGGHHLRLKKKKPGVQLEQPRTPSSRPTGCDLKP